ncbi:MAG TPA: hypothetical protein VK887_03700, partial [Pseudonocardiaceae bacterium]|nr:hypothetical protein [Pseudonocardiaceae bacterium]
MKRADFAEELARRRTDAGLSLAALAARAHVHRLDLSVERMARAYTPQPADELLRDVRTSARQIGSLLEGRATLAQRRRLLTAAGWIALFAATLHVDRGQR